MLRESSLPPIYINERGSDNASPLNLSTVHNNNWKPISIAKGVKLGCTKKAKSRYPTPADTRNGESGVIKTTFKNFKNNYYIHNKLQKRKRCSIDATIASGNTFG